MGALLNALTGSNKSNSTNLGNDVSITIVFVCQTRPDSGEVTNLRHELSTAYKASPWRYKSSGMPMDAEIKIDDGTIFEVPSAPSQVAELPRRGCMFNLTYGFITIKESEIIAFRKHAKTVGERLAHRRLRNVAYVESITQVKMTTAHLPRS